jgi:eukaryotic-like serine/threonine-protein kinase
MKMTIPELAAETPVVADSASGRDWFVELVRVARILTPQQLERAISLLPASAKTSQAVASAFMTSGLLTQFQCDRLLRGKSDGFYLGSHLILEPIGQGTSGRVYLARHRTMGRLVAIKLLHPESTPSAELRAAFQESTRAAAQLLHPHIVTAFDANQAKDRLYIVLEYVDGTTIQQLIERHGPLSIEQASEYVRQAANGLAFAHERGMLHGNLNPNNLLLGRSGAKSGPVRVDSTDQPTVKLLNLGFSRLKTLTPKGSTCALNHAIADSDYFAPEQLSSESPADLSADVFSLGCVLHFLLTGKIPQSNGAIHQFEDCLPIQSLRANIPSGLTELLSQMLAKQPESRPTAAAIAKSLEPYSGENSTVDFDSLGHSVLTTTTDTLSGLYQPSTNSPFAELGQLRSEQPNADCSIDSRTPLSMEKPRPKKRARGSVIPSGSVLALWCVVALVLLVTGWAIGLILKSVVR